MKHIFIVILLFFSFGLMSQSTVTARKVKARDVLEVATYRIVGISNDGTFTASATDSLVTQSAIKEYLSSFPVGGTTNTTYLISSMSDTTTITTPVNGDIAFVDSTLVAFRSTAKWNVFAGGGGSGSNSWYDLVDVPAGVYADTLVSNEWQNASQVSIADSGGDYIATNVEGALGEIADSLTQHRIDIDAAGDDLGNHTATQNIDAAGYDIDNVGTVNTDILSTVYTKQNNLYATGIRSNISNVLSGDTLYVGILTKSSFSGAQNLKISIGAKNGYSSWLLNGYSSSYTEIVLCDYHNSTNYDFSLIEPVIWTDGNNVHIGIVNNMSVPSYTTSCSVDDYGGGESSWTVAASTTLPAGFVADVLERAQYRLDDVTMKKLSSKTYYEDDLMVVGLHSDMNTVYPNDTLYVGSIEKTSIDNRGSSIEIDITGYTAYSKWVMSGYGAYSKLLLAYSNQISGDYDPAGVKPVVWLDGNTYHFAITNETTAPSYYTSVKLTELATNAKSEWTKATSTTLPAGFNANVLTEKATTFNSVKINSGFETGNYVFNDDQAVSGGSFGNKPFGLNATTEELEVVSGISGLYVNVYDISNRLTNTILDNVLYELLDKIEALESPPYVNLFLATSQVASSASPIEVNFSTSGGSQFSYNTTNDEATYTGTDDFKALISWQATVSSSVSNEVQFTIYENQVATANSSMSIDNSSNKQSISGSWIQTISANDDFSLNVESVDLAGSADITIHKAHFTITKISN